MPVRGATPSRRRTRRTPLDRARIVRAAVRIADARGTDAVSMRALAAALGVEAMSLYSHVASKEELLGMMAAHVLGGLEAPPRSLPPETRLRQLAESMRATAHAHPAVFPLAVLAPLDLDTAVAPTEIALAAFLDAGLGDAQAIRSQRVFLSFVRGCLLWEIGSFKAGRWSAKDATLRPATVAELNRLDEARFPESRRLASTFSQISPDRAFEEGLSSILAALIPARARAKSRKTAATARKAAHR